MRADIALKLLYFFAQTHPVYSLNQEHSYVNWRVFVGYGEEACEVFVRDAVAFSSNSAFVATVVCRDDGEDLINSFQEILVK